MTRFHLWSRTTTEDLVLVEEARDGQTGQPGQEFATPLTGAMVLTPGEYYLIVDISAGTNAEFTGVRTASSISTFAMTFTPQ
jgi:hypothetical protein